MKSRVVQGLSTLVALVVFASAANAQFLEFIFTQARLLDALEVKEDLQYYDAVSTDAMSLMNVPQAQVGIPAIDQAVVKAMDSTPVVFLATHLG